VSRVRTPNPVLRARVARRRGAAFTLLELLVVMGILLVLATLTAISVGKVTRDAKLANATNTLIASLGNARAIAIRDNTYVLVSFRIAPDRRSRIVPREPQVVQVITSKWTGEVVTPSTPLPAGVEMPSTADVYGERFLPVPGVPQRELPSGVYVAGPGFFRGSGGTFNGSTSTATYGASDRFWFTQPTFVGTANFSAATPTYTFNSALSEVGNNIGILFAPDGRMVSRLGEQVVEIDTVSGSDGNAWAKPFVDLDGNGFPSRGTSVFAPFSALQNVSFFYYDEPIDETFVDLVPYLAVFNMAEARDRFDTTAWRGPNIGGLGNTVNGQVANVPPRVRDLSLFIDEQSDRITFNRYTGVAGILQR
jgi:prepilin-type N-terminal cleavage/methylation domain-containing protein